MKKTGKVNVHVYSDSEPEWEVTCLARLDTGAARTSIDIHLADFLRLDGNGEVKVRNALGVEKRETVWLTLTVEGEEYTVEASVSDRNGLSCPVLIGRDILS